MMGGLLLRLAALSMLASISIDVQANEKEPIPFSKAIALLISDDAISKSDRQNIAQSFIDGCQHINQKIPNLSPTERE